MMNQRTPQLLLRIFLLIFCLALLVGCAGMGRSLNPRVTLVDIKVKEVKTLESAFQIELRVLNPHDTTLTLSGIECDLNIDGKRFASGVAGEVIDIPAYGSAIVPVTVYASVLDMLSSVIAFIHDANTGTLQRKPLRYELVGHVRLSGSNIMARTVPFASKGELSLNPSQ